MADTDNNNIFADLRNDFDAFWEETFDNELLQDDIKNISNLIEPKYHKNEDSEILKIGDDLRTAIACACEKEHIDLEPVLEKLHLASEKLQKYKVTLEGEMPQTSRALMALLARDMYSVPVRGRNEKHKVHWYAHLLHQVKLLGAPSSKSYRKLLTTLAEYWNMLVKPCYNSERRYLAKLAGFVCQIDGERFRKLEDFNREFVEVNNAKVQYEKQDIAWIDEKVREYLREEIDKSLKRLSSVECKKGPIGSRGGRLINNGCEMVIPEGALRKDTEFRIDVTPNQPEIPEEYISISAAMACVPPAILYEPAKISIPQFCTTDDPDVEAIVMMQDGDGSEWKRNHSEPLKDVKNGIRFFTKRLAQFVVAIKKKCLVNTAYSLRPEVWYSPVGNFSAVFYVDDKMVKENWERDMERKGFSPSQASFNPLSVKGEDPISVELAVNSSDVVVFDTRYAGPFTVKENIVKHCFAHRANFRLRVLPVGNEMLEMHCVVIHKEEPVARENWNLMWYAHPNKGIQEVFRDEIIPSFREVNVWRKFADSHDGLSLTDREINHGVNYDKPWKEQKMRMLQLWMEKNKGKGKDKDDQNGKRQLVMKLTDLGDSSRPRRRRTKARRWAAARRSVEYLAVAQVKIKSINSSNFFTEARQDHHTLHTVISFCCGRSDFSPNKIN